MGKYYPLADRVTWKDREKLKLRVDQIGLQLQSLDMRCRVEAPGRNIHVMAKHSGEKRPPREGEWYLSGAIVAAYKAKGNLSATYQIATLTLVEEVTTKKEVEL